MSKKKLTDFEKDLQQLLKDPQSKILYEEYGKQLEIAYQVLQLRKKKKLTQKQLAKKIGTTQSNLARMEAGKQNFSTNTLVKIADALDKDLKVQFI